MVVATFYGSPSDILRTLPPPLSPAPLRMPHLTSSRPQREDEEQGEGPTRWYRRWWLRSMAAQLT